MTPHARTTAAIALGREHRAGLMQVEEVAQRRILEAHARAGVTFLQPATARRGAT